MNMKTITLLVACLGLANLGTAGANPVVGKWERHVIALGNPSYAGNPFEIEVDAVFTHAASGTVLVLPGYYAGNQTWKIGFMPIRTGTWTFSTSSQDPDLDGVTGSLSCVESGRPGLLAADPMHPKKWKFADGSHVVPIGLLFSVFLEDATPQQFAGVADFLKNEVGGHYFNFRLTNLAFEGNWQDHHLDLGLWNRFEERLEVLADRGLGVAIMPYTDDQGKPPWPAQSPTEELLFRYLVARVAAYPVVVFNTGIDISEYRNQAWVNWYGQTIRSLDPYAHPVSSRHGGGSGPFIMTGQTFDSQAHALAKISSMRSAYVNADEIPVSEDDNWGEDSERFDFGTPADIRRAFWKAMVAGGLGAHVRDNVLSDFPGAVDPDLWFHASNMADRLDSEQWLRLVNPFLRDRLGTVFGQMEPDMDLVDDGHALADAARTTILYFLPGVNDRFDPEPDGTFVVRLSGVSGSFLATWFNPRNGTETILGVLEGGANHNLTTPTNDDWLLLLTISQGSPIFADGFESGNTSSWSTTAQ